MEKLNEDTIFKLKRNNVDIRPIRSTSPYSRFCSKYLGTFSDNKRPQGFPTSNLPTQNSQSIISENNSSLPLNCQSFDKVAAAGPSNSSSNTQKENEESKVKLQSQPSLNLNTADSPAYKRNHNRISSANTSSRGNQKASAPIEGNQFVSYPQGIDELEQKYLTMPRKQQPNMTPMHPVQQVSPSNAHDSDNEVVIIYENIVPRRPAMLLAQMKVENIPNSSMTGVEMGYRYQPAQTPMPLNGERPYTWENSSPSTNQNIIAQSSASATSIDIGCFQCDNASAGQGSSQQSCQSGPSRRPVQPVAAKQKCPQQQQTSQNSKTKQHLADSMLSLAALLSTTRSKPMVSPKIEKKPIVRRNQRRQPNAAPVDILNPSTPHPPARRGSRVALASISHPPPPSLTPHPVGSQAWKPDFGKTTTHPDEHKLLSYLLYQQPRVHESQPSTLEQYAHTHKQSIPNRTFNPDKEKAPFAPSKKIRCDQPDVGLSAQLTSTEWEPLNLSTEEDNVSTSSGSVTVTCENMGREEKPEQEQEHVAHEQHGRTSTIPSHPELTISKVFLHQSNVPVGHHNSWLTGGSSDTNSSRTLTTPAAVQQQAFPSLTQSQTIAMISATAPTTSSSNQTSVHVNQRLVSGGQVCDAQTHREKIALAWKSYGALVSELERRNLHDLSALLADLSYPIKVCQVQLNNENNNTRNQEQPHGQPGVRKSMEPTGTSNALRQPARVQSCALPVTGQEAMPQSGRQSIVPQAHQAPSLRPVSVLPQDQGRNVQIAPNNHYTANKEQMPSPMQGSHPQFGYSRRLQYNQMVPQQSQGQQPPPPLPYQLMPRLPMGPPPLKPQNNGAYLPQQQYHQLPQQSLQHHNNQLTLTCHRAPAGQQQPQQFNTHQFQRSVLPSNWTAQHWPYSVFCPSCHTTLQAGFDPAMQLQPNVLYQVN